MTLRDRWLLAACLPMLMLGGTSCAKREEPLTASESTAPIQARVAPAAMQDLATTFEAGGVIRARTTASLVSRIVAEVREVRVAPGDRVKRGQVLVTLDDRDLSAGRPQAEASAIAASEGASAARAERDAAEAALVLARTTHERVSTLRAKNSATPQELDQAVAGFQVAQARLRSAEARMTEAGAAVEAARAAQRAADVSASFALITAPFDGLITNKLVEPGNMASPGVRLVEMEETSGFRLEVRVDEARAAFVEVGTPVTVEIDRGLERDGGETAPAFAGRVAELARAFDAGAHSFLVKIDLPSGAPVRSGMFARARFAGPVRRVLALPVQSVVRRGQLTLVFVVDAQSRARMRQVRLATRADDRVEVLAGVDAGERVVLDPPASLADGVRIRPSRGVGQSPTLGGEQP